MPSSLHVVAELPQFLRDAAAAGLTEEERQAIVDTIAADPQRGDDIRGSGGVRKVRFAGRGKGKSGGYRVVTAYFEIAGFKKLTNEIARYWQRRKT